MLARSKSQQPLAAKQIEAHVITAVTDYMRARGWRPVRMSRPVPDQYSELGMADRQYIYYLDQQRGLTLTIWVEFKSPHDKRRCTCLQKKLANPRAKPCGPCNQRRWQQRESDLGAVVLECSDAKAFIDWYQARFAWLHSGDRGRGQLDLLIGK